MEIKDLWKKAPDFWQKYKYVILVLAFGLVLMLLPERKNEQPSSDPASRAQSQAEETDEVRLARILSQIHGAGEVQVLLSLSKGEETLFQTDDDISMEESSSQTRIETVVISQTDRTETGLIRQVNPPVYQGAVIVCQGGDDPRVKLAIVDAVSNITGLGSDRISVLKMK